MLNGCWTYPPKVGPRELLEKSHIDRGRRRLGSRITQENIDLDGKGHELLEINRAIDDGGLEK